MEFFMHIGSTISSDRDGRHLDNDYCLWLEGFVALYCSSVLNSSTLFTLGIVPHLSSKWNSDPIHHQPMLNPALEL